MLRAMVTAGLLASLAAIPATAETNGGPTVTVWEVDTSGRPPFERRRVEVPVADAASMEMNTASVETVRVWSADYSGRPPFRRSYQDVPVVDAASVETEAAASGTTTPKPFHKRRHR